MVIRNLSDLPRALENLDRCYILATSEVIFYLVFATTCQLLLATSEVIFYLVFATTSTARNNIIVTFTT